MDGTKIDWADATMNPVTGCQHECPYCYARKIAQRYGGHDYDKDRKLVGMMLAMGPQELDEPLYIERSNGVQKAPYPWYFLPTLHRYRLDEYAKKERPRDIFVCSMADLFGEWVPDSWIQEVFDACRRGPQHRYLFLTKNPQRYEKLEAGKGLPWADNFWFGTTCTKPGDGFTWFSDKKFHWFVSIEPLHGPMSFTDKQHMPEWVIVGAETGHRAGKIIPERDWVLHIKEQCQEAGVSLWMKESLRELMGEDFSQAKPWAVG